MGVESKLDSAMAQAWIDTPLRGRWNTASLSLWVGIMDDSTLDSAEASYAHPL